MTTAKPPAKLPPGLRRLPSGAVRWEKMVDGRRMSGSARTVKEALAAQAQATADATRGGVVDPSQETLGQYLTRWLTGKEKTRSPRSQELQADLLRRYIQPALGDKRLQKVTPADLRRLFDDLTARDLGHSTQRQVHQFLHCALRDAVRIELLPRNVAEIVRPTPPRREDDADEVNAYTPEEASAFLTAARADHRGAVLEFAMATGMRRGEFCGLRWVDVDLNKATAQIRETVSDAGGNGTLRVGKPKTASSRRTVYLSPDAVALLQREQERQGVQRAALGQRWQESGRVFVNMNGGTLLPNNLRRDLERIANAAGVRRLPIHSLRHTYASLSLRHGVPVEVVSKQLGHTDVAFTLRRYRTVYQSEQAAWAVSLRDMLGVVEK